MGTKGNELIQGMIRPGNRNPPGEKGGPVLEQEKVLEDQADTAQGRRSEPGIGQNLQYDLW
jgi:hypothetical protein